jgi:hypothetical protein
MFKSVGSKDLLFVRKKEKNAGEDYEIILPN